MKKLLTITAILYFSAIVCYSQKESYRYLIMGVPQYLMVNGIRIDIDKSLGQSNRWLSFSPQFYYANSYAINDVVQREYDLEKVIGAGTGIEYKYVFSDKSNAKGVYIKTGLTYNYYQVRSNGLLWVPEAQFSSALVQRSGIIDTEIHKVGVQWAMGILSGFVDRFLVDIYMGFGIRLSLENSPGNSFTDLGTFGGDYGYSGTMMIAGIRFGLGYE